MIQNLLGLKSNKLKSLIIFWILIKSGLLELCSEWHILMSHEFDANECTHPSGQLSLELYAEGHLTSRSSGGG